MKTIKFNINKVHFVNETNKAALLIYNQLRPILDQYIDKKIVINNNQNFSKSFVDLKNSKVDHNISNIEIQSLRPNDHTNISTYLNISYTGIYLNVSICFNGGSYETKDYYCHYEKQSIYLGTFDIKTGILIELQSTEDIIRNLSIVIDAKEQKELIDQYNDLLNKAEALRSKINYSLRE